MGSTTATTTTTTSRTTERTARRAALTGALLLVLGCAAPAAPPRSSARRPAELHEGPLTDYVAAAGLRWLIVVDVAALAGPGALLGALEPVLPAERRAAFASLTGFQLERVTEVVIAGYDLATLYLVETDGDQDVIEARFGERLVAPAIERRPHPRLRVMEGAREVPWTLVSLRGRFVAISVGDPTPARVASLYALGKLRKAVTALEGASLRALGTPPEAPVRLYAAGPFTGGWARGLRGLLGGAEAALLALDADAESLRLAAALAGRWEPALDIPRLEAAWNDLATSPLGVLTAADTPRTAPRASSDGRVLRLELTLQTRPLVHGLQAVVAGELGDFLSDLGRTPPRPKKPSDVKNH